MPTFEGHMAETPECSLENWNRVIAINLTGVFLCLKYEIPLMLKHGGGNIVNTASGAGLVGLMGAPAYVAAKHGVAGLTKATALEFAQKGIRVNAVCPGFIRTPMVERVLDKGLFNEEQIFAAEPMHRMVKPEEIAEAVLWLCSEASSFVTGCRCRSMAATSRSRGPRSVGDSGLARGIPRVAGEPS
jgi:NAD(P)-dependent dehydrogenase (short-subunit alcohol dehydrogenase family)